MPKMRRELLPTQPVVAPQFHIDVEVFDAQDRAIPIKMLADSGAATNTISHHYALELGLENADVPKQPGICLRDVCGTLASHRLLKTIHWPQASQVKRREEVGQETTDTKTLSRLRLCNGITITSRKRKAGKEIWARPKAQKGDSNCSLLLLIFIIGLLKLPSAAMRSACARLANPKHRRSPLPDSARCSPCHEAPGGSGGGRSPPRRRPPNDDRG
jgi:hypothetical protein